MQRESNDEHQKGDNARNSETGTTLGDELQPAAETIRAWVETALAHALPHVENLGRAPVTQNQGGAELARRLREHRLPEEGSSLDDLLKLIFDDALSLTYNTAAPGYFAFIPGGGLPSAAVADLVTALVNRYVTVWLAAPGLVEIEQNTIRWLLNLVPWPDGEGILLSGGSLANFTALHTARSQKLGQDPTRGTIYTSREAHHSIFKAARLAGFRPDDVRSLPVDDQFALRIDALRAAVREDQAAGLRPFLVVANAGSTNTGAIDPLRDLARFCAAENLWLHVDAAYGGPFLFTERGRAALNGIDGADSVTIDPHKALFLPYGSGALLVKNRGALRAAHEVAGAYMPAMQENPEHVDFAAMGPELTRSWRGLRLWLPLKLHGARAFRAALDQRLDWARHAEKEIAKLPGVEIVASAQLSLFVFRLAVKGMDAVATETLNRAWLEATNARGRVFLTGTNLQQSFVLRMCVLHLRTDAARVEMALEDLRAARLEVLASVAQGRGGG